MRLALYQPDIPQNAGTMLRLGACMGVAVDIVGPCGFVWTDRRLKRAGMDYLDRVDYRRHDSWEDFAAGCEGRLVLLTTAANMAYTDFDYDRRDVLLVGQESAGVPPEVAAATAAQVRIPMTPGTRSLNVALAAAMVLGEALRQTGAYPGGGGDE